MGNKGCYVINDYYLITVQRINRIVPIRKHRMSILKGQSLFSQEWFLKAVVKHLKKCLCEDKLL